MTSCKNTLKYALVVYFMTLLPVLLAESFRIAPSLERRDSPVLKWAGHLVAEAGRHTGLSAFSEWQIRILERSQNGLTACLEKALPFQKDLAVASLPTAGSSEIRAPLIASLPEQKQADGGPDAQPLEAKAPSEQPQSSPAEPNAPGSAEGGKEASSGLEKPSPDSKDSPEPATPQQKKEDATLKSPKRILVLGDSFIMEGFGPTLQKTLMTYQDVDVIREGKYSTGLVRQDVFNWPEKARELVQRLHPDVVCICLGANDPQDIIGKDKKRHIAGTDSWQELYYGRVKEMLASASSTNARVVWIGLPVMGKEKYEKRIRLLSSLQQRACDEDERCTFISTEESLKDEHGNYTTFIKDGANRHVRIRSKDKIHVTREGGKKMVESILPQLESMFSLQKKDSSSPEEDGKKEKK